MYIATTSSSDINTSDLLPSLNTNSSLINISGGTNSQILDHLIEIATIWSDPFKQKEEFLFKLFINQRKVYRYLKAYKELENCDLDDEEFERIEDTCVLTVQNDDSNVLKNKLLYFYQLLHEYAPEEIEFLNNEDISELISTSEHTLNLIEELLNNENS